MEMSELSRLGIEPGIAGEIEWRYRFAVEMFKVSRRIKQEQSL